MSDDTVVEFNGVTRLPMPAERVLDNAPRDMQTAIVIGYDADGEFYFKSSEPSGPEVMWLLQLTMSKLIQVSEGRE